MKKILVLSFCLFCIFYHISCDFNAPLRNKMLNYYSNEENYVELQGEIKAIEYKSELDELFLEIDLIGDKHNFPLNEETSYGEFVLVYWSSYEFSLQENDIITFVSAPMYFYNGHNLPVVRLEKEEEEHLAFSEGHISYLEWIKETFKAR